MKTPLAIFASYVGSQSQTYVQRHVNDLLPGGTAVITGIKDAPELGHWQVEGPMLNLSQLKTDGIIMAVARKFARHADYFLVKAAVQRFLREHRVEVIMGEFLDRSMLMLEIARDMGIRFFGHAHGYDISAQLSDSKWQAKYPEYNNSDGIITINNISKARLISLGVEASKIHVVPCGVVVADEPATRPEKEVIRCLAVGRMVAKKAPILTLDAFRRALAECSRLHLDYIGAGPLLPAAEQFVHAFSLGDYVTLHNSQPNEVVQSFMKEADIFLQHSRTDPETGDEEGLPVAILEAMSYSLPIISTRHAGIPEAVQNGHNGFIVDEGNNIEMARHIVTLARDSKARSEMGVVGWRLAKEKFSWNKERVELLNILGLKGT